MSATASTPIDLGSIVESRDPIEAVILFTRTGKLLGAWTRASVPIEVITVMAATLMGSIETLSTALGAASPQEISSTVDSRRIFAVKVNPQAAVLVVAAQRMSEAAVRAAALRIVHRLPPLGSDARGPSPARKDRRNA